MSRSEFPNDYTYAENVVFTIEHEQHNDLSVELWTADGEAAEVIWDGEGMDNSAVTKPLSSSLAQLFGQVSGTAPSLVIRDREDVWNTGKLDSWGINYTYVLDGCGSDFRSKPSRIVTGLNEDALSCDSEDFLFFQEFGNSGGETSAIRLPALTPTRDRLSGVLLDGSIDALGWWETYDRSTDQAYGSAPVLLGNDEMIDLWISNGGTSSTNIQSEHIIHFSRSSGLPTSSSLFVPGVSEAQSNTVSFGSQWPTTIPANDDDITLYLREQAENTIGSAWVSDYRRDNFSDAESANDPTTTVSMLDYQEVVPIAQITGASSPTRSVRYQRAGGTTSDRTYVPRWHLGPIAFENLMDVSHDVAGTQTDGLGGTVRPGGAVDVYYAPELVVQYNSGENFEDGSIHLAFPITDKEATANTLDGADAFDDPNVDYWGIPNGIPAVAEFWVRVTNAETNETFDRQISSLNNPFVNKNCPFLIQDSLVMDISIEDLGSDFGPGDQLDFSAVAFWATEGRRTMIWSEKEVKDQTFLCATPEPFSMDAPVQGIPTTGANATLDMTINWETPTGGRAFVEFLPEGSETWQILNPDGALRSQTTFVHTLDLSEHRCDEVTYRIRLDLCEHTIFTQQEALLINAEVENPWGAIPEGETIYADKGYQENGIQLNWSVVEGNGANYSVDSYVVQRRPYDPANQGSGDDWIEVYATGSELTYFDEEAASGILYEYRISANIQCGVSNYLPYWSPKVVGYRSALAEISGEVYYGSGSPVESVYISVDKMTGADARLALKLDDNNLLEVPTETWNSELTGGFNLSQWLRLDAFTPDHEGAHTPVLAWVIDDGDGGDAEFVSLRAIQTGDETYDLGLFQAGSPLPMELPEGLESFVLGEFNHLAIDVVDGPGDDTLRLIWNGDLESIIDVPLGNDFSDQIATTRAFRWGAAQSFRSGCFDPMASNFDPLATLLADCTYSDVQGCTNADASNYDPDATQDLANCTFPADRFGKILRLNWFSDGQASTGARRYPVIRNVDTDEIVWAGDTATLVQGNRSLNWQPSTYRFPLGVGNYEVEVWAVGNPVTGTAFSGNFDLYDSFGHEYINCTQYIPYEELDPANVPVNPYAFATMNSDVALGLIDDSAPTTGELTMNGVINDASTCLSWSMQNEFVSGPPLESQLADRSVEMWFNPSADATSGQIPLWSEGEAGNGLVVFLNEGQLTVRMENGGDVAEVVAKRVDDSDDPAVMTGYNVVMPDQWHHFVLSIEQGGDIRLELRAEDWNENDGVVWNNLAVGSATAPVGSLSIAGLNTHVGKSWHTGSTHFSGEIQRFAAYNRPLSAAEAPMLFAGPVDGSAFVEGLLWASTASWSGAVFNKADISATPQSMTPGSSSAGLGIVNRAPGSACISGCNIAYFDASANSLPSDFNPFATDYAICNVASTGLIVGATDLLTGAVTVDEIRIHRDAEIVATDGVTSLDATAFEASEYWRYIAQDTPGLIGYYPCDEAVGNRCYDGARSFETQSWFKHDGRILNASEAGLVLANPADSHFTQGEPIALRNAAYTDQFGQYQIANIRYTGTGSNFKILPTKGPPAHEFAPGQMNLTLGDGLRSVTDMDFFDISSFELDVYVRYQGRETLGDYSNGTDEVDSNYECPVPKVGFKIDGQTQFMGNEILKTNHDGYARLTVPIGTHQIEVVRTGHEFVGGGSQQLLMTNDRLGSENGITFVDVTKAQAVGKVVGGLNQIQADWADTKNNLGIAKFFLIPLDSLGGEPLGMCPAIPITTDTISGHFDTKLLPEVYRIATLDDVSLMNAASTAAHFTQEELNLFPTGNVSVEGWDYPTPQDNEWYDALDGEDFILFLETDPNPTDELLVIQENQNQISKPAGSFRADLMYEAPPSITTWQMGLDLSDQTDVKCPTSAQVTALPEVVKPFIGSENLSIVVDGKKYMYDLRNHFDRYQDPTDNSAAEPFPFGMPLVEEDQLYCMGVAVTENYRMQIQDDVTTPDVNESFFFEDQMLSSSPAFQLTIYENISIDTVMNVSMNAQPVVVRIYPQSKSYSDNGSIPLGTLDMSLTTESGTVHWSPFDDYTLWAGSLALPEALNVLDEKFQAVILGDVITAPGTPISTAAELDMILRDPPGDQSFASVSQGSEITTALSETRFNSQTDFEGQNTKIAPTIRFTKEVGAIVGSLAAGVSTSAGFDFEISPQFSVDYELEKRYDVDENIGFQETTTFAQSLSTTAEVDAGDSGNQDLYFGRTENVLLTVLQEFGLHPRLALNVLQNARQQDPRVLTAQDGDVAFVASDNSELLVNLAWNKSLTYEIAPASYFAKTQYDIENNIIPQLEALRDQYFQDHQDDYNYPSATPGGPLAWGGGTSYPPGMYLANNDDPRWWLIHRTATEAQGFSVPTVPLDFNVYAPSESNGPGYEYLPSDLSGDSVRVYNNMLLKWRLMLARNELDKLNARQTLQSEIANYDNIDELNNPLLELLQSNGGTQLLTSSTGNSEDLLLELEDLWGPVNFEPYFLAFSGNTEFSQSYSHSNTQSRAKSWVYTRSKEHEFEGGVLVDETGIIGRGGVKSEDSETIISEDEMTSSIEFSYTLADDDQEDYYLVAVMPGRGADGPIFLNIGAGATRCPWDPGEQAKYEDYYLYFANALDQRIANPSSSPVCGSQLNTWKVTVSIGLEDLIDGLGGAETYEILNIESEARANRIKEYYETSFATDGSDVAISINVAAGLPMNDPIYHTIHPTLCAALFSTPSTPSPVQPQTIQVEQVSLYVETPGQTTISASGPMDDPLVVDVLIDNQSFVGADADYFLRVIPEANSIAATVSFGGDDASIFLPVVQPTQNGEYTTIPASISALGLMNPEYLEGSIQFEIYSACDQQIRDTVTVDVTFEPACSDIELVSPVSGWTSNVVQTWSNSQSFNFGDQLHLEAGGLNLTMNNYLGQTNPETELEAVVFEYRTSDDLQWNYLDGFTRWEIQTQLATGEGKVEGDYSLDSLLGSIEDDFVRFRARSQCIFGLTEYSEVAAGSVDRLQPEVFGEPLPLDRVFEPEDELTIRFNEPMDPASFTAEDVVLSGHFNGEKQWNAGVQFGSDQSILLPDGPPIMENTWRFSAQLWLPEYNAPLEGTIFSQGTPESAELRLGFNADGRLELRRSVAGMDPAVVTFFEDNPANYPWTPLYWNTVDLKLTYDHSEDGLRYYTAEINVEGVLDNGEIAVPQGPDAGLIIGNNASGDAPLSMPLTDFRFWQGNYDQDAAQFPKSKELTGGERGLAAWLPLTEMEGIPVEASRGRSVVFSAGWTVPEGGAALRPSTLTEIPRVASIPAEFAQSTTLEFWFRPDGENQAILSTHERAEVGGDVLDDLSRSFEILPDGRLGVYHKGGLLTGGPVLSAGWHHCAYVRDAENTTRLYLNGAEIASMPSTDTEEFLPAPLHIGARVNGVTGATYNYEIPFTGWVDEIRFWSSALEPEAIQQNLHERMSPKLPDLLLYAPFDSLGVVDVVTMSNGNTNEVELAVSSALAYQRIGINASWTEDLWSSPIATGLSLDEYALVPLETSVQVTVLEDQDISEVMDNADNDEFIVAFEEDALWKFEDQLIQVHLGQAVRDELGNPLKTGKQWSFIFDRHPLHLSTNQWAASVMMGQEATTAFTLSNEGINQEPWSIQGLPDWLEATPSSGTLGALSSVEIVLTASQSLMLGEHRADFRLVGDFCDTGGNSIPDDDWCYGERFHVNCLVEAETPTWTFNPAMFDASMTVIAQVFNNGFASYDERDIVLAYVGGELRGQAQLNVENGPQRLSFLTVFYDAEEEAGLDVEFRVWDASNGVTWTGATTTWPTPNDSLDIVLTEEGYGEIFQPLQLHTSNRIQQNIHLNPGWNWVSFNVKSDDLMDVSAAFADVPLSDLLSVKHHEDGVALVDGELWSPLSNLSELDINEMYMVEMASDDLEAQWSMSIEGVIPDPVADAADLNGGWNPIGYIGQRTLPVEAAMQSLWDADTVLTVNDVIKSRYDGFAVYAGNGNWIGSLQWLEPGQGYKLKLGGTANGAPAGTWVIPEAAMFAGMQDRLTPETPAVWPQNIADLPEQQAMILDVALPAYVPRSDEDVIGVFSGDQCVGQAHPVILSGVPRFFLTAYGSLADDDVLTFRWFNAVSGNRYDADEQTTFNPSELLGTPDEPFVLHFRNAGLPDGASSMPTDAEGTPSMVHESQTLTAVPNPFSDLLTLRYNGPATPESAHLLDGSGREVANLSSAKLFGERIEASGPVDAVLNLSGYPAGMYFLEVRTTDGTERIRILKQ